MILLWKAVELEVGCGGCKRTPKRFDLLNIWVKMPPKVPWLEKMAAKVCTITHEDLFGGHIRKSSKLSLWEKFCRLKLYKNLFGHDWENLGKDPSPLPKICLLLHRWWKGTSDPIAPLLKGQRGKYLAMPPFSGVPVHIILHALSLLLVAGYSVSL